MPRAFTLLLLLLLIGNAFPVTANQLATADLRYPALLARDPESGTVYIADRDLPGIWRLVDGKLEIYFQATKQQGSPLRAIGCLAVDRQGRLLAGDSSTRDVYRFDAGGVPQPLTGNNGKGQIGLPSGIAVSSNGDIFVSDLGNPNGRPDPQ